MERFNRLFQPIKTSPPLKPEYDFYFGIKEDFKYNAVVFFYTWNDVCFVMTPTKLFSTE